MNVYQTIAQLILARFSDILFYASGGKMQTYDISLTISQQLPVWPGDPSVVIERVGKMEAGDNSNVSRIDMGAHTGTHVDAPFHFLGGDSATVDLLPLKLLTGRVYVLHLPDNVGLIDWEVLEQAEIPPRTRRLLFRTRNSNLWGQAGSEFNKEFVAVSPDGAQYLVDRGVKLVGVDYLSVAPYQSPAPTHEILLKAGVVVLEGLDLSKVSQGRYTLYCLPLKLANADGAPARAILVGV
jgi:arylformamidase